VPGFNQRENTMQNQIDMKTFDGLEQPYGKLTNVTLFVYNHLQIAVAADGTAYALNHRSTDPYFLNYEERSTWAHCVGVKAKDVDAYVRRKREQRRREDLEDEVRRAVALLATPQGKRIAAALKKAGEL